MSRLQLQQFWHVSIRSRNLGTLEVVVIKLSVMKRKKLRINLITFFTTCQNHASMENPWKTKDDVTDVA